MDGRDGASPLSLRASARFFDVPGRAAVVGLPPLSFRSEARNLVLLWLGLVTAAVDGCVRSLPAVEMTEGAGRDGASSLSLRASARFFDVPGRVAVVGLPPLSFRREARNLVLS